MSSIVNGSLILIRFGASGSEKFVLAQTSTSFGLSRGEIDLASKDSDFMDKTTGKLDASLSFEAKTSLNQTEDTKAGFSYLTNSIANATAEEFSIVQVDSQNTQTPVPGSTIIKGKAFFSALDFTYEDDGAATVSATLAITEKPDTTTKVPES